MTARMQKNIARYALWAAVSIALAALTALLTQLNGTGDIVWRPIIAAAVSATIGVLTMAIRSMYLTRVGSEDLGVQVDHLREEGVHRKDMVVLPKAEAISLASEVPPIHPDMTPEETDQLLTLIRTVTPKRAIVVLSDDIYREPPA